MNICVQLAVGDGEGEGVVGVIKVTRMQDEDVGHLRPRSLGVRTGRDRQDARAKRIGARGHASGRGQRKGGGILRERQRRGALRQGGMKNGTTGKGEGFIIHVGDGGVFGMVRTSPQHHGPSDGDQGDQAPHGPVHPWHARSFYRSVYGLRSGLSGTRVVPGREATPRPQRETSDRCVWLT
jgi:hypothetical protein